MRSSSTPVRCHSERSAVSRGIPAFVFRFTTASSCARSVCASRISRATRRIAASRLTPASTQTTMRSSASGTDRRMRSCRCRTSRSSTPIGMIQPQNNAAPMLSTMNTKKLAPRPERDTRAPEASRTTTTRTKKYVAGAVGVSNPA